MNDTSRFRAEIRAIAARLRAEDTEDREVQRAFEDGQVARLGGLPVRACPRRLPALRCAWVRGWQDADRQQIARLAQRAFSSEERAQGLAHVAELRQALKGR